MPDSLQRWMKEVARLTQSGRLGRVAQFIQQSLGAAPAEPAEPNRPIVVEGVVSEVPSEPTPPPETQAHREAQVGLAARPAPEPGDHLGLTLTGQHTELGMTRGYELYLPPAAAARTEPLPLVVMLHGCSQNPQDFAAGTGMNELAREKGFAVLYPAQSQDANPGRCWNWYEKGHQQRGQGEPAVLAGLTHAVMAEHGFDARRIYAAGLSAGGAMAAVLGHTYPDLYAAVGIHSGLASGAASDLMSALSAMQHGQPADATHSGMVDPVPTIVFHGDSDTVVHPDNGARAIEVAVRRSELAIMASPTPAPVIEQGTSAQGRCYTRITHPGTDSAAAQAEHWLVHGAGHAWSGGSERGSYTDPSGPDASREMWRFFSSHVQPERRHNR